MLYKFLIRWFVSSLGLYIAAGFLNSSLSYNHSFSTLVMAGLILAIINTILKPLLIFLSIPALIITLGLFMFIINGVSVYLMSRIYSSFTVSSFWAAVFAGLVIGLVNYLVSTILGDLKKKKA